MAYFLQGNDTTLGEDEDETLDSSSDLDEPATVKKAIPNKVMSFLAATDVHPGKLRAMAGQPKQGLRATRAVKENLLSAFEETSSCVLLPEPQSKECVRVYLRVKPKTLQEEEITEEDHQGEQQQQQQQPQQPQEEMVQIETPFQIALHAPKESHTYKNSMNGAGRMTHRYAFTHIFPPETDQPELFNEMVLPRVTDFLEGQNQLLFTYGATSSGKTYTIQGEADKPGILPRALDVIFNSVGEKQTLGLELKPNCFNRVVQMKEKDIKRLEDDKVGVFDLGRELQAAKEQHHSNPHKISGISTLEDSLGPMDVTNMSVESLASLFPGLNNRVRDDTHVDIKHDNIQYAIWISFAEIYNESIFDLLEKIPRPKRKGDKAPKRNPLKLAEDNHGSIYIRGLKEIKVNSADEAYQVMMIGRENLHFAATRLNHHSSRSHCIFTIKAIRVAEMAKPHLARVSMLSFCDLAGSERIKKTMNTGARQKEAGNINTSLLVLGRCLKAIRHNQTMKEARKQQIVPFRESKLTRMFQSFLVGHGRASMIVNISQAPYLFDESMTVLKFAAITSKITVQEFKAPEPVKPKPKKRQTRFSIMVEKSHLNPLMGRGSVAWEMPAVRSTLCPTPVREMQEEEAEHEESTFLEDTVVDDGRYDGFLKLIESLKDQLIKAKQEKLKLETELRAELCQEFNTMIVDIEHGWEKRLKDQKNRYEEFSDYRVGRIEEDYNTGQRKRQRLDETVNANPDETALFEKEELETEVKCLQEKLAAVRELHDKVAEEGKRNAEEVQRKAVELHFTAQRTLKLENELKEAREETEQARKVRKEVEESASHAPIVADMEAQIKDLEAKVQKMETEKKGLMELLDEAGEEFMEKSEEVSQLEKKIASAEAAATEQRLAASELTVQLEEARLLLTDSSHRNEEMEKQISDLEEQLERADEADEQKTLNAELEANLVDAKQQNVEHAQEKSNFLLQISELKEERMKEAGKLEAAEKIVDELEAEKKKVAELEAELASKQTKLEQLTRDDEVSFGDLEKRLRKAEAEKERVERELNDEIEAEKAAKMKLKTQAETLEKAAEGHSKEVESLEREVKILLQKENQQMEAAGGAQNEVTMIRKQMKAMVSKAEVTALEKKMEEQKAELEKANFQLKSLSKEDSAFSLLQTELEKYRALADTLEKELTAARAQGDAKDYDVSKAKEEKEKLMQHYDGVIKKKSEELAMEKREAKSIREAMSKATPVKKHSRDANELAEETNMLREELQKKTNLIKTLESMIPSQKKESNRDSEDSDDNAEDDNSANESPRALKKKLAKMAKELEKEKRNHKKDLAREKKCYERVITDYKESNLELQKRVCPAGPSASTSMVTDASTLEADDSHVGDTSMANESTTTDGNNKSRKRTRASTRTRGTRVKKGTVNTLIADTSAQASFEDSNAENDPEEDSAGEDRPRKKRSTRVTRSRPVRKAKLSSIDDDADVAANPLLQVLKESNVAVTPSPSGRKKLFQESDIAAVFTPPADSNTPPVTPRTVVKRQLRARSSRK